MIKLKNIYRQSAASRRLGINRQTFGCIVSRMRANGQYFYNKNGVEFSLRETEDGSIMVYIDD